MLIGNFTHVAWHVRLYQYEECDVQLIDTEGLKLNIELTGSVIVACGET